MTLSSSTERQEWYNDYVLRLEADRAELARRYVARVMVRQLPEGLEEEREELFIEVPK